MKRMSLILVLLLALSALPALAAEFVLIVHPGNPDATLSEQDAKNIFLGKKSTWSDGSRIVAFIQKDSATTEAFTQEVVKKTPQQFLTYWRKAVFTGQGKPPVEWNDDAQMKKAVAAQPGAIGYISAAAYDSTVKQITRK